MSTNEPKISIKRRYKKTRYCLKCKSRNDLTYHHVIPKAHEKDQGSTSDQVTLCRKCHDKLEYYILSIESFIGSVTFGKRFKLKFKDYYIALINFLGVERCADIIRKEVVNKNIRKRRRKSKKTT